MGQLIEVSPGLWTNQLVSVWHVDGKTYMLLTSDRTHWVPGDHVAEIVKTWNDAHPDRPAMVGVLRERH